MARAKKKKAQESLENKPRMSAWNTEPRKEAVLQAGGTLAFAPAEGGLLLKKSLRRGKHYALAEILDSFAPSSAHPEVDFSKAQGEEVW